MHLYAAALVRPRLDEYLADMDLSTTGKRAGRQGPRHRFARWKRRPATAPTT